MPKPVSSFQILLEAFFHQKRADGNEARVGVALKESGVAREALYS